jgi:hypothetical protein
MKRRSVLSGAAAIGVSALCAPIGTDAMKFTARRAPGHDAERMQRFFAWMDELNREAVRRRYDAGRRGKKSRTAGIAGSRISTRA